MIWRGKSAAAAALVAALFSISAVARGADDPESLVKQGEASLKDRNIPPAIEAFRKAISLKSELECAHQGLRAAVADSGTLDVAALESEVLLHSYSKASKVLHDY